MAVEMGSDDCGELPEKFGMDANVICTATGGACSRWEQQQKHSCAVLSDPL